MKDHYYNEHNICFYLDLYDPTPCEIKAQDDRPGEESHSSL
jgi:hypothetical protein